jgi:hypothetical protein
MWPRVAFCWRNCRSNVVPVRPRAGKSPRTQDQCRADRGPSASGTQRAPTPPSQGCHVLSGRSGRAKCAGYPGPVHQNLTILQLLVLANLANDVGPELSRRVCAPEAQRYVVMRDGAEVSGTDLFGVRIVHVDRPQNAVINGSRPCGIHVVQGRDRRVSRPTEWGDGPLDNVYLVARVHVSLEPKNNVIPRLCTISRRCESCRTVHKNDAGDGSVLHHGKHLGDVIRHCQNAIP